MILESKEIEIKELRKKLETITKEHESSKSQLKSVELEYAASEVHLEQNDDDNCEITENSSQPEEKTQENELTKRFRSKRNVFKYKMKSIQVNRFFFYNL